MSAPTHHDARSCDPLINGLLEGCAPDVTNAIVDAAQVRRYAAGEIIFTEGEPVTGVFCHCTGEVAIELGRGSERHEVGLSRPGMLLGFREPERIGTYIVSGVARTDAVLFFIPIDLFLEKLHTSPPLMFNIMRTLSERIDGLEERLHT
jgi:CRP-like cAMP-binding protein